MAAVQLRGGPPQLKLALAKHSCSTPVTLPTSGGGPEAGREMVVDGASLHAHLSVVAGAAASGGGAAAALYPLALAYCGRLAATGLKVTVVLPAAAAAPGGGEWAVARGAREAGCALLLSASAPTLLLAYARRAGPALFALLTDDTDFFVLGADKIALLSDVVVERCAVTCYVWGCDAAWLAWRRSVKAGGRAPGLLQRSQVAVLLAGGAAAKVPSPVLAAAMALSLEPEEELGLPFFVEAAGAVTFAAPQLAAFRAAVAAYAAADGAARGGWEALALPAAAGGAAEEAAAAALPAPAAAAAAGGAALDASGDGVLRVAVAAPTLTALGKPLLDVGSGLKANDYVDFDDKELVARTRNGGSFKVLQAIRGWSPEAAAATPLRAEEAFEYIYSQRKEHGGFWKALLAATFAEQAAAAGEDKARKKYLSGRSPSLVLEELRKLKGPGAATAALLEALSLADAADQLLLRRMALRSGPASVEWRCAQASWEAASGRTRAAALEAQHACTNKAGNVPGAPPVRYKHQEELLSMLDAHLERSLTRGGGFDASQLPLRIILSTPTGSGKTFTALMASKELGPKHPSAILVYSVPTKQVLKRVGQECEATNAVYWIAARDGDHFQVRRPYSTRTKRVKGEQGAGKGSMEEQLGIALKRATESNDRGGGTPSIFLCDVYATAALCAYARTAPLSSPFHHSRLLLYLDEPNMGIHLSPDALDVVQRIMAAAPHTAVLASATLPSWTALPAWWRGDPEAPAKRVTITQPPYDLPASRLMLLDSEAGELRTVSLLDLFAGYAAFRAAVHGDPRLRILLLRHLSPAQANALLAAAATEEAEEAAAAVAALSLEAGEEAAPAAAEEAEARGAAASWASLQPDVRTSRETLEAALLRLGPGRYDALRRSWREAPAKLEAGLGLRGALSKTGVTMIATMEPRRVALELAGWRGAGSPGGDSSGGAEWTERVHELKKKRADSSKQAANAAREAEREAKRDGPGEEGPGAGGGGETSNMLELRPGLAITQEEAGAQDDDVLVMLSRGVAYACADGAEGPLVKRLYQQALLHVPEDATRQRLPPIHALVVDYSSVYGTDCPAVDTLLLCDDLGEHLTAEDAQQFLGRLRRDGRAIFLSARTLRACAAGGAATPDPELELRLESLPRACASLLERQLAAGGAGSARALGAALAAQRKEREPFAPSPAELARTALATLLLHPAAHPPCPAGEKAAAHEAASLKGWLKRWAGSLAPLLAAPKAGLLFLRAWEAATSPDPRTGAAAAETGARLLKASTLALQALYEADALEEEALLAWHKSALQRGEGDEAAKKLAAKVQPLITWLEEAEEDESDEE